MGRISKRAEIALRTANELLATTKKESTKVQLTRTLLTYELHQQQRADANKNARQKWAENEELTDLRSKVEQLTNGIKTVEEEKKKEVEGLTLKLRDVESDLELARKNEQDARKANDEVKESLKHAQEILERLGKVLPQGARFHGGLGLFHEYRGVDWEILTYTFECLKIDHKKWRSWDQEYGKDSERMLEIVLSAKEQSRELVSFLRMKLWEMGRDYVDAINAIRDFYELKIDEAKLQELARPHVVIDRSEAVDVVNRIPDKWKPRLTMEALVAAMKQLSDPKKKVRWLTVIEQSIPKDPIVWPSVSQALMDAWNEVWGRR